MEQNKQIQVRINQLSDSDIEVRNVARKELVAMGSEAVEALIEVITSQSGRSSWEAAKALSNINDPRCLPVMKQMLFDGNVIIAQTAVTALINYDPPDLVEILTGALHDTHQVVTLKIIESLGDLNRTLNPKPLVDIMASTDSASIRYTIIDTLIKLNVQGDHELVLSFADDPDRHVQQRVIRYKEHFK